MCEICEVLEDAKDMLAFSSNPIAFRIKIKELGINRHCYTKSDVNKLGYEIMKRIEAKHIDLHALIEKHFINDKDLDNTFTVIDLPESEMKPHQVTDFKPYN